MHANQQQPQPPQQQQLTPGGPPQPAQPMAPGVQQRQGFPQQQPYMGGPGAQAPQQQMFMAQQMGGAPGFGQKQGGPQFAGRGGPQQQYRQKPYPQGQMNNMMGGAPGMFNMMPGSMPMMGLGPMAMGGQMQNSMGLQQQQPRRDYSDLHSLYIGNLSDRCFDLDLYKFFKNAGFQLASAKVMFDHDTKVSKGFGYLNFYSEEEAARCLETMNNAEIMKKHIVLNKKKDRDFDSKANVLVRNLPKDMNQKELSELCAKSGNIKSCKLEVFGDGQSRGFGYVQFEKKEEAEAAIKALNGMQIGDKQIELLIHNKKADREDQGERYTNLFVQNLPPGMNDAALEELFKEYGEIVSAQMNAKNNRTGFVSFKFHNEAKAAKEGMDQKLKTAKDSDYSILVAPHISRKENDLQPKSSKPIVRNQKEAFKSNIFVRYIPKHVTEEMLREEFKAAGHIASVKLKDHAQRINGETFSNYQLGYVLYADVESAQKCIKMFDASNCFGYSSKALKVDFWQAQDDLKQEAEEKSAAGLKQLIRHVMRQKEFSNGPGMHNGGYQGGNQHHGGDGYNKGNRPNRGRGGNRGGGRGQGRGGNNQNKQGGQQQRQGGQQQYYVNKPQQPTPGGMPQPPVPGPTGQPGAPMLPEQVQQLQLAPVDIKQLDGLQGEERKTFVGNHIYGSIQSAFGDKAAPVITGMLLDEAAVDFKMLLTDNSYFVHQASSANNLLQQSRQDQGQTQGQ